MDTCGIKLVSDSSRSPSLACDKPRRFHLLHHDPVTGVRYMRLLSGHIVCFCGSFRSRRDCPLRTH
jgi:hypothetical protein